MPETLDTAKAVFRCQAYLIVMKGDDCARIQLVARETRAENRDACIGCPAGAARARLQGRGRPLKCAAVARGKPCGGMAEEGGIYCLAHQLGPAGAKAPQSSKAGTGRPRGETPS